MPKGDATYPTMTIDECLAFADEWSRGMTYHAGSQGWRVVCMLLAEEVRGVRQALPDTFSESKDWREGSTADRIEWLKLLYRTALEDDDAEQCRLLGMGGEREARLLAQLAESQAREVRLRAAIAQSSNWLDGPYVGQGEALRKCREALSLPADDSALREMIEAARQDGLEEAAKIADSMNGSDWMPSQIADEIRARSNK